MEKKRIKDTTRHAQSRDPGIQDAFFFLILINPLPRRNFFGCKYILYLWPQTSTPLSLKKHVVCKNKYIYKKIISVRGNNQRVFSRAWPETKLVFWSSFKNPNTKENRKIVAIIIMIILLKISYYFYWIIVTTLNDTRKRLLVIKEVYTDWNSKSWRT